MIDKPFIIATTGITASGKSTLAEMLAESLGFLFIEEEWSDNPYLENFNKGISGFFEAEKWFIERDFSRLKKASLHRQNGVSVVLDKPVFENYTYVSIAPLNDYEKKYCNNLIDNAHSENLLPDLIIDLKAESAIILERIKTRNRKIEATLSKAWIDNLLKVHEETKIMWPNIPIISISSEKYDIINNNLHFEEIKDLIIFNLNNNH